jgi:hypothetical protein
MADAWQKVTMRDPNLWIKGRAKVAQTGQASGFEVLSRLNFGAPGRT